MTLEQFDHVCRAAAAVAGVKRVFVFGSNAIIPKDFDFAVSVARLFPMADNVLNDLVDEFRIAHPHAEAALRTNVEIWQNKILMTENT